ncbi:MAG: transcriptional repressor [Alphaproteobacteria bacterium]|nr:transcriptional repressor [Alphaproteobacteria bacterium]
MVENIPGRPERPFADALRRLKKAELRPTRQRLALGKLLFDGGDRHVTAEHLHDEATRQGIRVSLATVYNTLNQFTAAGLLREVVVAPGRSYFDTNISDHHHFFYEEDGALEDIPGDAITLATLPEPPSGAQVQRVDVVVRLRRDASLAD